MTLYRKFFALAAFLLVFALALSLVSCSSADDGRIMDYRDRDARFTMTFSSAYGDIVCDAVKRGDCTTLTLRTPERSAGLQVKISGDSCVIAAGECEIPLSEEAAAGLTDIFAALYAPLSEPIDASRTSDGAKTVITTHYGTLYLDENMLPCAVECAAWNGEMRTVAVTGYVVGE